MREMNSTGIVWCPSIPSDWEVRRVKDCFYISKVKAGTKNPVVLKLARSGVQVKDVTVNGGQMAESYDDYNPVQVGDLLLNPMDLYSGANCNVSEVEGVISPAYVNLRAKETLNPYYFDYYFKIQYWTMAMFAHGKGVSYDNRWTINAESVKAYELPFPSVSEQNAIVDIIKRKCTQIDALISNAQQQIEKLKAYKQSVITETVTKGLDPDVKMKDSGVEWIGEIPEHWNSIQLKYIISLIESGVSVNAGAESAKENQFGVLKTSSVSKQVFIPTENKNVNEEEYSRVKCPVTHNTLIVSRMNTPDLVGACSYVDKDYPNLFLPDRLWQVHIKNMYVKYVWYYLISHNVRNYYASLASGTSSSMQNISQGQFESLIISVPSLDEQQAIANYLDRKCSQIDKLIALKQQKIEKLQQYKKSLIYEYVTGKKEV